jgi:OTU domain-containing protein 6
MASLAQAERDADAATLQAVRETLSPDAASERSPSTALFTRVKAKSTANKRKSKARALINDVRDRELDLVSDPMTANGGDEAEVLDLADQLLEQLDAGAEPAEEVEDIPPPTALPGSRSANSLHATSSVRSGESESSNISSRLSGLGHSIASAMSPSSDHSGRKVSRGQARKVRQPDRASHHTPTSAQERKEAEADALRQQAREEVARGGRDEAEEERAAFARLCAEKHFELIEIPPDGHWCALGLSSHASGYTHHTHSLFSAVADQLNLLDQRKAGRQTVLRVNTGSHFTQSRSYAYQDTRKAAADYMRAHPNDFVPFITIEDIAGEDEGDVSGRKFAKYCDTMESTGEWGGQPEVRRA